MDLVRRDARGANRGSGCRLFGGWPEWVGKRIDGRLLFRLLPGACRGANPARFVSIRFCQMCPGKDVDDELGCWMGAVLLNPQR